jgi:mono/diheme cytochrome c family protein
MLTSVCYRWAAPLAIALALNSAVTAGKGEKRAEVAPTPEALAARVKELFRVRCFDCHEGTRTNGGIKILDSDLLLEDAVVAGKPDESLLYELVTADDDSVMPPAGQPRLAANEIDVIRQWIAAGAPKFPSDVAAGKVESQDAALAAVTGVEHVLKTILEHVRATRGNDRTYFRYFSINHLLTGGATREELDRHADAFAKAINHLSLEASLVRPTALDEPQRSVFAVDIRKLGWHKQPFHTEDEKAETNEHSPLNLFDLVLLEYPYAAIYEDSETFDHLVEEFILPANLARPVPYLRIDWFVSTATQPPLYEDFLQLPTTFGELEKQMGIDTATNVADGIAKRAGMAVSGVSRNNRVVERHPSKYGAFWQSFDFRSSKGRENIFQDPLHLRPTGGEMLFNLPNGMQGYYLATGEGRYLDTAPTDIVTDKFAENKTVRNGLSCMRCHENGMKNFVDTVRPAVEKLPGSPGFSKRAALELYAPQDEMERWLKEDSERFLAAVQRALGKPQSREPLTAVTQRFLDAPLQLQTASAELGLASAAGLAETFRAPHFTHLGLVPLAAGGVVRRDMWEEYYDQIVAQLGLGTPLAPLDGLTRQHYPLALAGIDVELSTSHKNDVFAPGDELVIFVNNKSKTDVFIELIGTSAKFEKVILAPATTLLEAGEEFRFPPTGALQVQGGLGHEQITLFASEEPFPAGQLLRGPGVVDRVFHPFYKIERRGKELVVKNNPAGMVKRTITIETR